MSEEIKNTEKKEETLEEKIAKTAKGSMKLMQPIENGSETVEEVRWDFGAVTGTDYVEALDFGAGNGSVFAINNKQLFCLFAVAVEKAMPNLTAADIRSRMMIEDAMAAVEKAAVFFVTSRLARAGNGSKK